MTVVVWLRWLIKVRTQTGQSFLLFTLRKTSFTTFRRSQFYITFKPSPNLDKKHTVFGKLVGGEDVLDTLEKLSRKDGTERPVKPVKITEVVMYVALISAAYIADKNVI
jgi:hypothetical protein